MDEQQRNERVKINSSSYYSPSDSSPEPKCWRFCVKNWPANSQYITLTIVVLMLYGCLYSSDTDTANFGSTFMRMMLLFLGAQFCGMLVSICGVPDMLGMIFFGILFRNIGLADFPGFEKIETFLRELALTNIMLLAGFNLDVEELKDMAFSIAKLTIVPIVGEVVVVAVLSNLLLEMPWIWCFLCGFVVTAISPNVVVTVILFLKEQNLGINKGIHTKIIAMTTFNDVIAIFLFTVLLGIIFTTGNFTNQILQGPVGIALGSIYGGVLGFFLTVLPSNKARFKNSLRFILTLVGGLFLVTGSKAIGFPSAGALGCVVLTLVAGTSWKGTMTSIDHKVELYLNVLWKFVKPISFAMIGKEVDLAVLEGIVVYGVAIIVIGSVIRLLFAYFSTAGTDELTWRERAYITISSLPKATIQASIGPLALELARQTNDPEKIVFGQNVLIVSVLAIIFTAPLGALFMYKLAPKWLKKTPHIDDEHL